ncbi:hypothetical protein Ga0466249_000907 [Sporomusaceae bacterium BoRhaA]|nr:hypothetical protein [Pelorhabdus rhamnosifermentans]
MWEWDAQVIYMYRRTRVTSAFFVWIFINYKFWDE